MNAEWRDIACFRWKSTKIKNRLTIKIHTQDHIDMWPTLTHLYKCWFMVIDYQLLITYRELIICTDVKMRPRRDCSDRSGRWSVTCVHVLRAAWRSATRRNHPNNRSPPGKLRLSYLESKSSRWRISGSAKIVTVEFMLILYMFMSAIKRKFWSIIQQTIFTHAAFFYCIHQLDFIHNITITFIHHFHIREIKRSMRMEK